MYRVIIMFTVNGIFLMTVFGFTTSMQTSPPETTVSSPLTTMNCTGVLPLPEISNTIIIFQEDNTQLQSTCTGDKLPCFFDVGWFLNTSRVTNTTASGGTTYFYNSTITVRVPPDINSTMLQCCVEYQFTMGGDLTTECRNVTDADIRNLTPTNDTVTSPVPMSSGDNATSVIIDSGTHNTFIIVGVSIGLVLIMITAAITAALIIVRVAITLRKKSREKERDIQAGGPGVNQLQTSAV